MSRPGGNGSASRACRWQPHIAVVDTPSIVARISRRVQCCMTNLRGDRRQQVPSIASEAKSLLQKRGRCIRLPPSVLFTTARSMFPRRSHSAAGYRTPVGRPNPLAAPPSIIGERHPVNANATAGILVLSRKRTKGQPVSETRAKTVVCVLAVFCLFRDASA